MKSGKGTTVAKQNLPEKVCATCGRPFVWRKKWARAWDDIRYCFERCRRNKNGGSIRSGLQAET